MNSIMPLVKWYLRRKRHSQVKTKLLGERFNVPRIAAECVNVIVYRPEENGGAALPVLFNVHGGAWVGGDASQQDSFCAEMSQRLHAFVVNINYQTIDVHPFPYPQIEIRDTVLYYAAHAQELGLDSRCFSLLGYSAGGHLCAGASMLLRESGFSLASQVLAYPFLDFTDWDRPKKGKGLAGIIDALFFPAGVEKSDDMISPGKAAPEKLRQLPPTVLIACGQDPLHPQAEALCGRMQYLGLPIEYFEYADAVHGFLEVNRPEYKKDAAKSPEQGEIARRCETMLIENLSQRWRTIQEAEG